MAPAEPIQMSSIQPSRRAVLSVPNPWPVDIPTASKSFVLLGSPIGPVYFCETSIERGKKVHKVLHKLLDLQDSQMAPFKP